MNLTKTVFEKLFLVSLAGLYCFFPARGFALPAIDDIWQVGVAQREITPMDTLWLAGYASRDQPAQGKLQELWAKALAIADAEQQRIVLVTTDLLGLPKNISDRITGECREKYGLERSGILLNSSHTHSGPVLRQSLYDVYPLTNKRIAQIEQYSDRLVQDIVGLIGDALSTMVPAHLYSGNGVVRFQVNRRNNNASTLSSQTDLNGPNDYAVPVLQVRSSTDELLAVAFGYACHATVLNGYEWCGDYPGYAQAALEQQLPGVTALFFQGCGGDQNPLPRRSVNLARQYGEELAAAVRRTIAERGAALSGKITSAYEEIELRLASPPSVAQLEKTVAGESAYRQRWARRLLNELRSGRELRKSYPYPVQVWKIGSQTIIALGGEVVVDYAIHLKRVFGQDIFVLGYSNDVMAYIPSVRILREGGYEGASSQIVYGMPSTWTADIETRIIQSVLHLCHEAGVQMPESSLLSD
jgi:hypothetical protein